MISRRAVAGAAGLALPGFSAFARRRDGDLSLEQVVRRHTIARGGARALDAIRSVRTDLLITEQGATVTAAYRATLDHLMRIDVALGGKRVWSEGIDAAGVWAWPGDKPAPATSSEEGARALRHGVDFNLAGLHRFPALGHRLTLAGREILGGADLYVVQIDMADGFQTFRYIDPASWMAVRSRDVRAIHPDLDATKKVLENVYEDFRPVGGVMVAFASRQVDVATGKVLQETRLAGQVHNPPPESLRLDRADPSLA